MPHLPPRFATGTERLLGHTVRVDHVQRVSEGLLIVMLSGDVFGSAQARPGAEVEFRVGGGELRHYTLADVDHASRTATLVVHTRGTRPGREWARGLHMGETLRLLGPGAAPTARDRRA